MAIQLGLEYLLDSFHVLGFSLGLDFLLEVFMCLEDA